MLKKVRSLFAYRGVLEFDVRFTGGYLCYRRQATSSRRCDTPVGDSPHVSLLTASAPTQTPERLVFSAILLAHGLIQQSSTRPMTRSATSPAWVPFNLQRQSLLPHHFGDTQIAIPDRLLGPRSTARRVQQGFIGRDVYRGIHTSFRTTQQHLPRPDTYNPKQFIGDRSVYNYRPKQ